MHWDAQLEYICSEVQFWWILFLLPNVILWSAFLILIKCSQLATIQVMMEIHKTDKFSKWIDGLRDIRARVRVSARIQRLACGNQGDVKPVGEGVPEMRIDCEPWYRVYYKRQGKHLIVLLAGGDKRNQKRDIEKAISTTRLRPGNPGETPCAEPNAWRCWSRRRKTSGYLIMFPVHCRFQFSYAYQHDISLC